MQRFLDEICLLLLCSVLSITSIRSSFAIVGFLLGVIVAGLQLLNNPVLRISVLVVFTVLSCIYPAIFSFIALGAYAALHERSWIIRSLWIVPCVVQIVVAGGPSSFWCSVVALCFVGCILGIKDARHVSEYRGLQRAYDALKEQTLKLSDKVEARNARSEFDEQALSEDLSLETPFFEGLTERELAVVNLVAEGLDNREISQRLFLSEGTVRNHISSILSKKSLQNRTQIAVMYYRGSY